MKQSTVCHLQYSIFLHLQSQYHGTFFPGGQELFMCGWNNKGQLGLGDTQDRSVLCHVQGLSSVRQVSCGWNHTLVITGNIQSVSNMLSSLTAHEFRNLCPLWEVTQVYKIPWFVRVFISLIVKEILYQGVVWGVVYELSLRVLLRDLQSMQAWLSHLKSSKEPSNHILTTVKPPLCDHSKCQA